MNLKKICAAILAVTLMAGVGVTSAFATNSESTVENARELVRSRIQKRVAVTLTDEQKEAIQARKSRMEQSKEKWESLTEEQREEIYALKEQVNKVEGQIIDKYLEWEIIDEETATHLKERLSHTLSQSRESGKMPMFSGKDFHGRVRFKCIDNTDSGDSI